MKKEIEKILSNYSPFERKVWEITSKIPRGETRSYQWVAKKAGNLKAYRAVGRTLAKNPFLKIIPCHRVIRKDGTLGGYSRGVWEKERLLKREGAKKLPNRQK